MAIASSATYSDLMTPRTGTKQVNFSIARLQAWAPGVTSADEWRQWAEGTIEIEPLGEPPLQQMPAMLRRHAGRLGRLALSPAYDALGEMRDVPMVFAARYGEVSRSVELLTALSAGEELSPTTFGLSVHNAVPGLFSMARKETANSISLAAGEDSAEAGVIEACGLIADGAERVLLVVADCPLPKLYEQFEDSFPASYGWSCLVSEPVSDIVSLSWSDSESMVRESDSVGSLAALPVLLGVSREVVRHSRSNLTASGSSVSGVEQQSSSPITRTWRWSRNA